MPKLRSTTELSTKQRSSVVAFGRLHSPRVERCHYCSESESPIIIVYSLILPTARMVFDQNMNFSETYPPWLLILSADGRRQIGRLVGRQKGLTEEGEAPLAGRWLDVD